jgi:uncharacterized membrane protein YfhO
MPVKPVNWTNELPIWVNQEKIDKSEDIKQAVAIQKGEGTAEVVAQKSAERVIAITAEEPLTVRIRTFNFPGWKAYVDNRQVAIKTEKDTGAMLIDIPEGKQALTLKFEDTPIRYYSKLISSVSFFIMMIFLVLTCLLRLKKKKSYGQ